MFSGIGLYSQQQSWFPHFFKYKIQGPLNIFPGEVVRGLQNKFRPEGMKNGNFGVCINYSFCQIPDHAYQ